MVEKIRCDNGIIINMENDRDDSKLDLTNFFPYYGLGTRSIINNVSTRPVGSYQGPYNKYLIGVDRRDLGEIGAQIKSVASEALKELSAKNKDIKDTYIEISKKVEVPQIQSPITKENAENIKLTDKTLTLVGVMMSGTRCSDDALSSEFNDWVHEALGLKAYTPVIVDCNLENLCAYNNLHMSARRLEKGDIYLGERTHVE